MVTNDHAINILCTMVALWVVFVFVFGSLKNGHGVML